MLKKQIVMSTMICYANSNTSLEMKELAPNMWLVYDSQGGFESLEDGEVCLDWIIFKWFDKEPPNIIGLQRMGCNQDKLFNLVQSIKDDLMELCDEIRQKSPGLL